MRVRAMFHAPLSTIIGQGEIELDADFPDVRSFLEELVSRFPSLQEELFDEDEQLNCDYQILLNGTGIHAQGGIAAPLREGDEVAFLMPLSGGL